MPADLDHLKAFVRLDFHPPNPNATMGYEDAFKMTGINLLDTEGRELFAKLNLLLGENIDDDEDDLEEFDFSGGF